MIGQYAIFNTKFACDEKYNGKKCKIIAINKYRDEIRYVVEFKDKKRIEAFGNEITLLD